ncbi:hypothetical protein LCGC14_2155760 [marine sediment metagenome]|uniref:Uncharacterized protein n=1 Tax=marine sediment metagenome TaxID=412755 RepID=A0A0F9EGI6_9ZZZZ|nr:hypothetical protein [Porticoccus sp.]
MLVKVEVSTSKKIFDLRDAPGNFMQSNVVAARKAVADNLPALEKGLAVQAPLRSGQTYRRTRRMTDAWRTDVQITPTLFSLDTTNKVDYTYLVVGTINFDLAAGGGGQAWMHKARWFIAGGVIRGHYQNIVRDYEVNLLDEAERRTGLKIKRRSGLS